MHSGFAALRERCPMNCGLRVELEEIGRPLRADIDRVGEIWSEAALAEPWRETAHEAQIAATGAIRADLRARSG